MNNYNLSETQLEDLRTWRRVQDRVKSFQNKANVNTFKDIFGIHGEKLFLHFRTQCSNDYQKFNTYLDVEQHNLLLAHIISSEYYNP